MLQDNVKVKFHHSLSKKHWWVTLQSAGNHRTLFTSETYKRKVGCDTVLRSLDPAADLTKVIYIKHK